MSSSEAFRKSESTRPAFAFPDGMHIALYAILFSGVIFALLEYGRMPFETMGLFFMHLAFAFFGASMWVMQRVRLFNWQSLLTTIAYGAYAFFYRLSDGTDPQTTMAITAELVSGWIFVMLITDMAVTRRIRNNKNFTAPAFALLVLTAVCTLIERRGGFTPVALIYLVVLCLIPVNGRDWRKILEGIFVAGLLSFIAVTVFSYFGDPIFRDADTIFLTKADLSQFYAMILALALYGIFYAKDKDGRFGPLYFFFIGWTAFTAALIVLKGCLSVIPGVILAVIVIVLFAFPVKPLSKFFIRLGVTVAVLTLFMAGVYFAAKKLSAPGLNVARVEEVLNKAPFTYMGDLSEEFTEAIYAVQEGDGAVGNIIKPNTPGALLNVLTESRANILSDVLKMVTWDGHTISASGDAAFILGIRNQYFQYLYEYGFLYGGLAILLFVALWITAIVQYVRHSRIRYLMPAIVLAMMLGVWVNVSSGVLYPIGFIAMLSMLPVLTDLKTPKKKVMKVTVVESSDEEADSASESDGESPDSSADEEDENDMVEGKNFIAAKFFSQGDDEEAPKKRKKRAKSVEEEEDDEEDGEIGRPTDRKKLEDVKIMNTAELSGLLTSEEIEEEKAPTLNAAGEITEEILTMEELDSLRKLFDETDKEIEEYISTKENEDE